MERKIGMIVKFLNGDLVECSDSPNIVDDICRDRDIHPLQLVLCKESDNLMLALINPRKVLKLSKYVDQIIFDEDEEEEYDPWTLPKTYFYKNCINETILKRAFSKASKASKASDDLPEELFANPHPLVIEHLRSTPSAWKNRVYANDNPSAEVVEFLLSNPDEIVPIFFVQNPDPRALDWVLKNWVDQEKFADCLSIWQSIFHTSNASLDLVQLAFKKRIELGEQNRDLFNNTDRILEFGKENDRLVTMNAHIWDVLQNYFECEKWQGRHFVLEKFFATRNYSGVVKILENGQTQTHDYFGRLATVHDSDDVVDWFLSNPDILDKYISKISANPNERFVNYFLDHPDLICWDGWIENPNPRTILIKDDTKWLEELQYCRTLSRISPNSMIKLLENTNINVKMSELLSVFAKTDDVEVEFDCDLEEKHSIKE